MRVSGLTRKEKCSIIHTTMAKITFKMREETLDKLRMLYALTGNSMLSIVDLLATQELARLGIDEEKYNELISHPKSEEYNS